MRLLTLVFITLLISNCSISTVNYYSTTAQSWRGSQLDALIRKWGQPHYQVNLPSGEAILSYNIESNRTYSAQTAPAIGVNAANAKHPVIVVSPKTTEVPDNGTLSMKCTAVFNVNKQGMIIKTAIIGKSCYGNQAFATKYTNQ